MENLIKNISIDEKTLIRSENYSLQRKRAITDLLEENSFSLNGYAGPFDLHMSIRENRLIIDISKDKLPLEDITIHLTSLRRIIKDYYIICESYLDAVQTANTRKIEAIDMGRRSVHNEGAEIVEDILKSKITIDFETARKLFALIYLLQLK